MLRFLRVRNFALIDQLEIHFEGGFNLISGETGAGKSIIVDALGLLAGSKASGEMVRSGESRAIVEAIFETDLTFELERLGLDSEGSEVIVRREISPDERNRVYINNQPSTVSALRELAPLLLDIHGQHDQQTLLDNASQLALIDAFADSTNLAARVRELFLSAQRVEAILAEISSEHTRKVERLDLLSFQHDEIQRANPKTGETQHVRERLEILSNAGKLLEAASRGYEALYESEASVLSLLAQTQRSLRDAAQHDARLQPILEQTEAARISIQDIAYALRDYANQVEADPQELERLQARLAELERLHRKYGPDLFDHLQKVRREMDSIGLTEIKKEELQQEITSLRGEYSQAAFSLSEHRRTASSKLESAVERELKSRSHKTLVFDEVDAGIGGKAAETVGQKLKELSSRYQVLCVTHLAQIAAFARHQYRIEKLVLDGRSVTRVGGLTGDARVEELARMMSGSRVTDAARKHVKELLKAASG